MYLFKTKPIWQKNKKRVVQKNCKKDEVISWAAQNEYKLISHMKENKNQTSELVFTLSNEGNLDLRSWILSKYMLWCDQKLEWPPLKSDSRGKLMDCLGDKLWRKCESWFRPAGNFYVPSRGGNKTRTCKNTANDQSHGQQCTSRIYS